MIFLAFFFPLAIYLLLLGLLNRCRHPLLVPGVWDGIGLLFGVSGFLLFAGPAVLSAPSVRWRLFWLLGKADVPLAGSNGVGSMGAWSMWTFLALLYFLLVVGGAASYLWHQRRLTAVYNADADRIERALTDICIQLGIKGEQTTILEVDSFPLMRHVTLRWEAADSPLRRIVESELSRRLSEMPADDSLLGGWLLTAGLLLLSGELAGAFFLLVHAFKHLG